MEDIMKFSNLAEGSIKDLVGQICANMGKDFEELSLPQQEAIVFFASIAPHLEQAMILVDHLKPDLAEEDLALFVQNHRITRAMWDLHRDRVENPKPSRRATLKEYPHQFVED
jgi:hypothetical protein